MAALGHARTGSQQCKQAEQRTHARKPAGYITDMRHPPVVRAAREREVSMRAYPGGQNRELRLAAQPSAHRQRQSLFQSRRQRSKRPFTGAHTNLLSAAVRSSVLGGGCGQDGARQPPPALALCQLEYAAIERGSPKARRRASLERGLDIRSAQAQPPGDRQEEPLRAARALDVRIVGEQRAVGRQRLAGGDARRLLEGGITAGVWPEL